MKFITNAMTSKRVLEINSEVTSTDVIMAVEKDGGMISRTSAKELLYGRTAKTCGYTVTDDTVTEKPVEATLATTAAEQAVAAIEAGAPTIAIDSVPAVEKSVKKSGRMIRRYIPGPKLADLVQSGRLYVKLVAMVVAKPEGVTIDEMYAAFPDEKQNTIQNEIWRVKKAEIVELVKSAV